AGALIAKLQSVKFFPQLDANLLFTKLEASSILQRLGAPALLGDRASALMFPNIDVAGALQEMTLNLAHLGEVTGQAGSDDLDDSITASSLVQIWTEALKAAVTRLDTPASRTSLGAIALVLFCTWWLHMKAYHDAVADAVELPMSIVVPITLALILGSNRQR
ncbi:hypothetical protein, partial [Actinoplanes campanulatus]